MAQNNYEISLSTMIDTKKIKTQIAELGKNSTLNLTIGGDALLEIKKIKTELSELVTLSRRFRTNMSLGYGSQKKSKNTINETNSNQSYSNTTSKKNIAQTPLQSRINNMVGVDKFSDSKFSSTKSPLIGIAQEDSRQSAQNFQSAVNRLVAPGLENKSKNASQSTSAYKELFNTTQKGYKSLSEFDKKILDLNGGITKTANSTMGFGARIKEAISSASQWAIAMGLLYGTLRKVQEGMQFVYDFDNQMTNIRMVTGQTKEETDALAKSYANLADKVSSNTMDVARSAEEWLRQGRSQADTNRLIETSQIFAKVGMLDSAEAANLLTSAINGYQISAQDAMKVVDKMSAIDVNAATSTKDLALALSYTASSAQLAGVSIDEVLSYIATVKDVTQQSAESIGNSFKTIFARIQSVKIGSLVDEEGESISNVSKVLDSYKIKLTNAQGTFRDTGDVLDELASRWNEFNSMEQSEIATTIAGIRQKDRFLTLMQNYDKTLKLQKVSLESAGSATEKFSIYQESASAATERLTNAFQKLFMGVDSGIVKEGINFLAWVLNTINSLGGLRTILIAVSSILITWKADAILTFFMQLPTLILTAISTLRGFATAMSVAQASLGAIGIILTAVSIGYSLFTDSQEKSISKALEASDAFRSQITSLNDLKTRMDSILSGTGTEIQKRDDLLSILKDMNSEYDVEAGKLKTVNQLRDEAITKIQGESKAYAQAYLEKNAYAITSANKYMTEQVEAYTGKGDSTLTREEILRGLKESVTDWYVKSIKKELTIGEKILYKATQATYDKALAEYEKQKSIYDQANAALEVISAVPTKPTEDIVVDDDDDDDDDDVETDAERESRLAKAKAKREDDLKKKIDIGRMTIEAEKKAIEDKYNKEIELLNQVNKKKQDELDLMKAKESLLNAQSQKTRRVYYEGQGWVWEADKKAIKEAQEALDKLKSDALVAKKEEEKTKALGTITKKESDYDNALLDAMKKTKDTGLRGVYGSALGMTELNGTWYDKTGKRAFSNGGVAGFTGLAMLHGKPNDEEVIFNGSQSRALYAFVKNLTSPKGTFNKQNGANSNVYNFYGDMSFPSVKSGEDFINELQLKSTNR